MNITHFITSLDITSGGPTISVTNLCRELYNNGIDVEIVTYDSENNIAKSNDFRFNVNYLNYKEESVFKLYKSLPNFDNSDLFHIQGIWEVLLHRAILTARERNKPYIISPRGMLAPWDLNKGAIKKKIALYLYQLRDLKNAHTIHVTSHKEAEEVYNMNLGNRIEIIPNGIDISSFPLKTYEYKTKKKAIFLSRIHQTKGVDILIESWSKIRKLNGDWDLEIIGNGNRDYINKIKKIIGDTGVKNVNVLGPLYGTQKIKKYHEADLFILPTHTENFGIEYPKPLHAVRLLSQQKEHLGKNLKSIIADGGLILEWTRLYKH
jgi:glycosyltransferase involved in cell wall biosynthesis